MTETIPGQVDSVSRTGVTPGLRELPAMAPSGRDLPTPTSAAVEALAPTRTLRAAVNLSNFLLVTGQDAEGHPAGVSPDMARTLAEQLGVSLELISYETPGALADDGALGRWDIGNIGAEPKRAEHISFTAAYCEIECTYLVPAGSEITTIEEVDRPGRRISCSARSAYGLWLERNIEHAELIQVSGLDASFDAFVEQELDALAGLRPRLLSDAERLTGSRILEGRFTAVQQAIGTPRDRDEAGITYLRRYVEAAKETGLVGRLIEKHAVTGLAVAPAAPQGDSGAAGVRCSPGR